MTVRLTIVVPTYTRPELLARCLAALAVQTLSPSEYEVVVADDAASDATREQVAAFAATVPVPVRYVPVTGRHGPAAARNVGWRAGRGDVLAFADDDTIPDRAWAAAGASAFARDLELAAATGQTVVPLPERPTDYERNESGLSTAEFITANCFVRRAVLEQLGGFDERFRAAWREDSDLHFALLERGLKVSKVPDAVVVHPVRPAPWGICLHQQRKVLYDALLYKKHRKLFCNRIRRLGQPWSYYAIVGAAGAGIGGTLSGSGIVALIAAGVWGGLTGEFAVRRLRGNSLAASHILEMAVTSALIPPIALFWRWYGALRFCTPAF